MRRRHLLLATLVPAAALAAHTGWFSQPQPWRQVTGWERIPAGERPRAELPWPPQAGSAPEIVWLGHSGFRIRWHGITVLLDPNLSPRCNIARRMLLGPAADGLGAVDAVLVSHAHYDHLDLPTLRTLQPLPLLVLPSGSEPYASELAPRTAIRGLAPGEEAAVGNLRVLAVPAFHNGGRHHPLPSSHLAVGYLLRTADASLYFAGDTGRSNDFEAIAALRPTLALLPIGAYSPRLPIGRYHLSPEQAVEAAKTLGVTAVVPCHFGTFALALDRPSAALPRFARAARAAGLRWWMPPLLATEGGGHG